MADDRIRVSNADGPASPRRPDAPSIVAMVAILAAVAVTFGLVTSRPSADDTTDTRAVDALGEPTRAPGFHAVATLAAGPWDALRIDGAYLFETPAGVTVITDDDRVLDVTLPALDSLFGAIAGPRGSVAFGLTQSGPALWHSSDNAEWTVEPLPWDGTVRAAASDGERLTLIGIERTDHAFTYVVAERDDDSPDGWRTETLETVPEAGMMSIPGGFVGRGRSTDDGGFGYVYSTDGREWSFLSDRSSGSRLPLIWPKATTDRVGLVPAYDTPDGALSLPGDDRPIVPPEWPISGVWLEGETVWVQTPSAGWSSIDGSEWSMFPIDAEHGVHGGFSVLLPAGDQARIATLSEGGVALLRWDPGTPADAP